MTLDGILNWLASERGFLTVLGGMGGIGLVGVTWLLARPGQR